MSEPLEIYTVGHSTHPIDRFLELLESVRVEAVADVRRFPGSRRNPQFGARPLAAALDADGISYESFGETLGGRRSPAATPTGAGDRRERPDNSAWRNPSFRAYADYMPDPTFAAGLDELEALAKSRRTAIMCAEAHPSRCHRQLIADALMVRGWRVVHLLADGGATAHALSSHAVVGAGEVSYPGQSSLDI